MKERKFHLWLDFRVYLLFIIFSLINLDLFECQKDISLLACDLGQPYSQGICRNNNLTLNVGVLEFISPSLEVIGNVIFKANTTALFRRPKSISEYDLRNNPQLMATGSITFNGTLLMEIDEVASLGKIPLFFFNGRNGVFNQ